MMAFIKSMLLRVIISCFFKAFNKDHKVKHYVHDVKGQSKINYKTIQINRQISEKNIIKSVTKCNQMVKCNVKVAILFEDSILVVLSCYRSSSITKVSKEEILYNISSSGTFIIKFVTDRINLI